MREPNFLVYEHWRPDTDACFYVGKGKLKRSRSFESRNSRYGRIVKKLKRSGLKPEIKIIRENLTESEAFSVEIARIAHWRALGVEIANYTDGGDGCSGRLHSEATKELIRKKAIGRKWSPEMRIARSQQRRNPHSLETRAKISESAKIAQRLRFENVKKTKAGTTELKHRMMLISRKAAADPELRARRSANAKALWADPVYREKMKNRYVSRSVVEGFS